MQSICFVTWVLGSTPGSTRAPVMQGDKPSVPGVQLPKAGGLQAQGRSDQHSNALSLIKKMSE